MYRNVSSINIATILRKPPSAFANIRGNDTYPQIMGTVKFYQLPNGVLVAAEVDGLPTSTGYCQMPIFAIHIHEGDNCRGDEVDPFRNVGMHYNPYDCPHPYHAGDMPPLFGANGKAFLAFLTARFTVDEIIGKTVIIHDSPDDFMTQPAGNAGNKIACGTIKASGRGF
ncbi:MAG: superoxide dismutase family protein [Ruminococcaceae bacterium]|nr:superoxide dismutase family protein [Oscillospiraceae bacterium]